MPAWIHHRADRILSENPDMPKSEAFAIATQQGHALGKTPKGYGTDEGRRAAKAKYRSPATMRKTAFVDALPAITGLVTGYGPGRNLAEETAASIAPEGRRQRSGNIARELAVVGAPLGGLVAMALAKRHGLAGHVADAVGKRFPGGLIAEPAVERELVMNGVPGVSAVLGSMGGGVAAGGLVGGLQRLRGPLRSQPNHELMDYEKMGELMSAISKEAGLDQMRLHPKPVQPLGAAPPAQRFAVKTGEEAQPTDKPPPQKIPGAGGLAAKSIGGDIAASLAGAGSGLYSLGKAQEEVHGRHSGAAADLYRKVEQASPVPVYEARQVPGGQFVPRNTPGAGMLHEMHGLGHLGETKIREPHILMGKNLKSPSFLAHEAGHAHIDRHALGRLVQNLPTTLAGKFSPSIGFIGGLSTGGSEDERTRNLGMASGLIASAPQLLYEAGASIKGYRDLKRLGASPGQLSAARQILLPAFGSYAAQSGRALASGAFGSAIGRAVHNSRVAKREKKEQQLKQATVNPVEKEDMQAGDEQSNDSGEEINRAEKAAFSTNQYSGVMNPPSMVYASSIPGWKEPPVKTAGPPGELDPEQAQSFKRGLGHIVNDAYARGEVVGAEPGEQSPFGDERIVDNPALIAARAKAKRSALLGLGVGSLLGGLGGKHVGVPYSGAIAGGLVGGGLGAWSQDANVDRARRAAAERHMNRMVSKSRLDLLGITLREKTAIPGLTPLGRLNSSKLIGAPRSSAPPGPSIAEIAKPKGYGRVLPGSGKGVNAI